MCASLSFKPCVTFFGKAPIPGQMTDAVVLGLSFTSPPQPVTVGLMKGIIRGALHKAVGVGNPSLMAYFDSRGFENCVREGGISRLVSHMLTAIVSNQKSSNWVLSRLKARVYGKQAPPRFQSLMG